MSINIDNKKEVNYKEYLKKLKNALIGNIKTNEFKFLYELEKEYKLSLDLFSSIRRLIRQDIKYKKEKHQNENYKKINNIIKKKELSEELSEELKEKIKLFFEKKEYIHRIFWNGAKKMEQKKINILKKYPNFKLTQFNKLLNTIKLKKYTHSDALKELQKVYKMRNNLFEEYINKSQQNIEKRQKILNENIKKYINSFWRNKQKIKDEINDLMKNSTNVNEKRKKLIEKYPNFNKTVYRKKYFNLKKKISNIEKKYKNSTINKRTLENIELELNTINKNINLKEYFGILKLINYTSTEQNKIYELLLKYLIDLDKKITYDYIYGKDTILLKINKILLKNEKFSNELHSSIYNNSSLYIPIYSLSSMKVYKINNKIYKYRHSRTFNRNNLGIGYNNKNNSKPPNTYKKLYGLLSYSSSILLIQFAIHSYLYKLCNLYVPDVINIDFDYNSDMSLIIMNNAFKRNNSSNYTFIEGSIQDFLQNENERESFIKDFFEILKKICEILLFYQQKCCFVHGDFHFGNILIKYVYIDDNLIYTIKIIDFEYSSIIINLNNTINNKTSNETLLAVNTINTLNTNSNSGNVVNDLISPKINVKENKNLTNNEIHTVSNTNSSLNINKYKMLKYINKNELSNYVNPYISNLWSRYDLLFYLSFFLFNYLYIKPIKINNQEKNKKYKKYIESNNIKIIIIILCNLFNINIDYIKRSIDINNKLNKKLSVYYQVYCIVSNIDNYRNKIYGKGFNFKICEPKQLLEILQNLNIDNEILKINSSKLNTYWI